MTYKLSDILQKQTNEIKTRYEAVNARGANGGWCSEQWQLDYKAIRLEFETTVRMLVAERDTTTTITF